MPSGPWPSALFPSQEPCLRFYKTGTFPLLPSLPSLDLPSFAPPVSFAPERAEDSFLISKPHPAWRPSTEGCLSSLSHSCICSPLPPPSCLCFPATWPALPSLPTPFRKDQSTHIPSASLPLRLASSPYHLSRCPCQGYQQCPCCHIQADTSAVSCLACQSLTLLAKPSFVARFPFSNSWVPPSPDFPSQPGIQGKDSFELQLCHYLSLEKLFNSPSLLCESGIIIASTQVGLR